MLFEVSFSFIWIPAYVIMYNIHILYVYQQLSFTGTEIKSTGKTAQPKVQPDAETAASI